jgi:hypothetical protein
MGFVETLRGYVCEELMSRYESTTKPLSWRALDVVGMEVVYQDQKEDYRKITLNGRPVNKKLEELGGAWSTGEFGTVLIDLFAPRTAADFHYQRDSHMAGVLTKEYSFNVTHANSHWTIHMGSKQYDPAYKGSVWIDPKTARVMRIEMQAYGFPADFESNEVESATDYEYVRLGDAQQYLLPVHAETLSCRRATPYCSRNTIDFRNYRKYAGGSPSPAEQMVRLNVTVSDKSGHRMPNLPQSAFTVLENGTPQQIKIFQPEDAPVSMGLVIDNSGNMRDQRQRVRAAAFALAGDSKPQDQVFIVNFNDTPYLDLPHEKDFTSDIAEMKEALARIDSRGGAAMRDAIRVSIDHLKEKAHKDKKVLVVVTDGNDNASMISLEDLVKVA